MKTFYLILLFVSLSIATTKYNFQNNYNCGIMDNILTSYKNINIEQNNLYNSCSISIKNYSLNENSKNPITCYKDKYTLCQCNPNIEQCNNNNQVDICAKEDIQLFINGNFNYNGNHLNDIKCKGKIFVYVKGNVNINSNGGGNNDLSFYIYSKGNVNINNNGNASYWKGAIITAEKDINKNIKTVKKNLKIAYRLYNMNDNLPLNNWKNYN